MLPSQPFDHQERSSKESQFSLRMNTVDPPPLPFLYKLAEIHGLGVFGHLSGDSSRLSGAFSILHLEKPFFSPVVDQFSQWLSFGSIPYVFLSLLVKFLVRPAGAAASKGDSDMIP